MICEFRYVLGVFVAFEFQSSRVFEKRSKFSRSVPCQSEDLCFDVLLVLLCDVNFSPFISQVF